ncbi:MAG: MopE-related protein [Polyangia bacterium]
MQRGECRPWSRFLVAGLAAAALALSSGAARAQTQIKPRILILFDTSGSMAWTFGGDETDGDGSSDPWPGGRTCCPGNGGSRIHSAKEAMGQMLLSSGDIEFGLMKFAQHYYSSQSNAQPVGWYYGNQAAGSSDYLRYYNNDGSATFTDERDWLCVGFGEQTGTLPSERDVTAENDRAEVLMWFNHHEYSSDDLGVPDGASWRGPWNDWTEQELRADGDTPLGEAVQSAYAYLQQVMNDEESLDPYTAECRPYSMIILTDGQYDGTDPIPEVNDLYDNLGVDSWVIGLAYASTTLDEMADVGGCHYDPSQSYDRTPHGSSDCVSPAGHAFLADSQQTLSSILYQIVSGSIMTEVCDGEDNDCDGEVDEGFELYCDIEGGHSAEDLCEDPGETVCNGVDDNCDGETDENLTPPDDGWGEGVCSHSATTDPFEGACQPGTYECQGTSGWVCTGGVSATDEICDAVDNDCDGLTDEDVAWDPAWGPNECGEYSLGECDLGSYYCDETTNGQWVCSGASTPGDEGTECDGLDNDCDGQTDEGIYQSCGGCDPALYTQCTADPEEGICETGVQYCDVAASSPGNPVWLACSGSVDPRDDELCNLLDDDCDGETDEDVPGTGVDCGGANPNGCSDYPSGVCPDGADQGECQAGTFLCINGDLVCDGEVPPAGEGDVCDDFDNDCDGRTDENITQPCGGCDGTDPDNSTCSLGPNEGQCVQGLQYCDDSGPGWGECQGAVYPDSETCDGIDNDCDGQTDETFSQDGDSCGGAPGPDPDQGECSQGTMECIGGTVECSGGQGPVPEGDVCDGLDNDCDGETDEWITQPCGGCDPEIYGQCTADPDEGICQQGFQYCPATGDTTCYGAIGPADSEMCNGLDDDCDGLTDEDIPDVPDDCGPCGDGTTTCQDGEFVCDGASDPGDEQCNNADDDCDGFTDEGLSEACGGGDPFGCDPAVYPGGECPDGAGQGACQQGSTTCSAGDWGDCQGAVGPSAEICDGIDNDCDGLTDEEEDLVGVGADDGDECSPGYGICDQAWLYCAFDGVDSYSVECCVALDGDGTCIEPIGPGTEVCDGLDNNCNSLVDEGLVEPCGGCDSLLYPGFDCLLGPEEGECAQGFSYCVAELGSGIELWGECQGDQGPIDEQCNLLDDDCDGLTDNDVLYDPPDCSLSNTDDPWEGICESGVWTCVDGQDVCEGSGPEEESCNGLDDDCDGEIDEELPNVGQPCGNDLGICESGTVQCVCDTDLDCGFECVGETTGVDEECNLLDDDCDGLTDEWEDLPQGAP